MMRGMRHQMKRRDFITLLGGAAGAWSLAASARHHPHLSCDAGNANVQDRGINKLGATFYVAPSGNDNNPGTETASFATIDRARLAVRSVSSSMTDDITVYLRAGTHTLSSTVSFDASDSGQNGHRIIYSAYPDEQPHVSGGQQLTGWVPTGNGLYRASAQGLNFRQLYVNGVRAQRARTDRFQCTFSVVNDGTPQRTSRL
jgi:hypothetical protein